MTGILLTRSIKENSQLQKKLASYNINFISFPLIEYEDLAFDANILLDYSNIIITSKHAAGILNNKLTDPTLKLHIANCSLWVVGKISAKILAVYRKEIKFVAKNIEELISNFPPADYLTAIYLSGNKVTRILPAGIHRQIIYKVQYCSKIEDDVLKKIKKEINHILIYSENCAKTLLELILKYNLQKDLENMIIIAISEKVAAIMKTYFKKVVYCDRPEQMEKLLLEQWQKQNHRK